MTKALQGTSRHFKAIPGVCAAFHPSQKLAHLDNLKTLHVRHDFHTGRLFLVSSCQPAECDCLMPAAADWLTTFARSPNPSPPRQASPTAVTAYLGCPKDLPSSNH